MTRTELIGLDRIAFIFAKGFAYLINCWSKHPIRVEDLLDCMLQPELQVLSAEACESMLDRTLGPSTEADPEDVAALEALMAKWGK